MKFNKLKREQNKCHKPSGRWPVLPVKVKAKTDNQMDVITVCGCGHFVSFKSNIAYDQTLEVLLCDVVVWLSSNIFIQVSPSLFINMHYFDYLIITGDKWEIVMEDTTRITITDGFKKTFDDSYIKIMNYQELRHHSRAIGDKKPSS